MKTAFASVPQRNITLASFALLLGLSALNASNARAGILAVGDTGVFPTGPFSTFIVGNTVPGVNTLTVDGGSVLDSAAGFGAYSPMVIGNLAGVSGTATVTGPGSKIVTTGTPSQPGLGVGMNGSGTLNVVNGGSATVNRFDATQGTNGTSSVKIDGAGSNITSGSTFNVGITGNGSVLPSANAEITNGAAVNAQTSVVGSLNGSNGKLTVDGIGSALNLVTGAVTAFGRAFLTIGREQKGEVDVLAGAKVKIDAAVVGTNSVGITLGGGSGLITDGGSFVNGNGALIIDGAGSEVRIKQINPFVGVGLQGNGVLGITNGGKLIVEEAGTGAIFVGRNVGGTGAVNVAGAGSELQAGRRLIIGTDATATTLIPGGTGSVNVSDGAMISATRVIVGALGTLTGGGGTIVGELVNHGNVAPGNSPGIMNVLGNVTLDFDGKVSLELGGTSAGLYDQLNARDDPATTGVTEGNLSINGQVNVTLFGGFNPLGGSFFDIFTALDITELSPIYSLPTLSDGLQWEHAIVSLGANGEALRLSVVPAAVPTPGSLALLGIGLLGLFAVSRRRVSR